MEKVSKESGVNSGVKLGAWGKTDILKGAFIKDLLSSVLPEVAILRQVGCFGDLFFYKNNCD